MIFREVSFDSSDYWRLVALRRQVLRIPLGLTFSPSALQEERSDFHLGGFDEPFAIAVAVMSPRAPGVIQLRQVAVTQALQSQGLGSALVRACEDLVRVEGFAEIMLHARVQATPFYERLGYACEGEPFLEIGIPHFEMRKRVAT